MDLAIRVDIKNESDPSTLSSLLDSLGGSYWIVREGGSSNPHVHVHYTTTRTLNAVRLAFKKKFPTHVGNGGYSIKQCDSDVTGYDRYMAKGDSEGDSPIIISRQGVQYDLDTIQQWHIEYWNVNQELMKKRRKKLGSNTCDQLLQICLDKGINTRGKIANAYLDLLLAANKPINIFAGKAAINTVWLKLCTDDSARNALLVDLVGHDAECVLRL